MKWRWLGRQISWFARAMTLALCFFILPVYAWADSSAVFDCSKALPNIRATELLRKVQANYAGVSRLHAKFSQDSFLAALDQSEMSSGEVWFLKPGKMKWEYQNPEVQIFILRDDTLWFYQAHENQLVIEPLSSVLLTELPAAFLMGVGDLERDFHLNRACQNAGGLVFELTPKASGKQQADDLKQFTLLVQSQSLYPQGAKVLHIGGNATSITFSEAEVNKSDVSDSIFVADFPKDADIIDKRNSAKSP